MGRCDKYFMRFPGGKSKALTLSYDDGVEQDIRLIEIMKKNGLKGTFNLNSGYPVPEDIVYEPGTISRRMPRKQCIDVYKNSGMEVAVHGLIHPFLDRLPSNLCLYDVLQDRANLELDYEVIVRGMAYPYGTYDDKVIEALKQCGIVYARTVEETERFDIPTDWLKLPSTCHHNNPRLMELAHEFVEKRNEFAQLFYLWGHSYEFDRDDNWKVIEEFAEFIGNRNNIWYATNIEIYEYIQAYHQLVYSMDGNMVYNPTGTTLYFEAGKQIYKVEPGKTIKEAFPNDL